jgi:predicted RNA-binding Zn-ribbon protein involved in translation (DUF1610 family)
MTDSEKMQILELYNKGLGYSKIAAALELPLNTVKSFLYRLNAKRCKAQETNDGTVCKYCGKPLQITSKRVKRFCSDKCRMAWWNAHQEYVMRTAYYSFVCPQCGKTFTVYGNSKRMYCSRKCFAAARRKRSE